LVDDFTRVCDSGVDLLRNTQKIHTRIPGDQDIFGPLFISLISIMLEGWK